MTTIDEWKGRVGREWAHRVAALEPLLGPAGAAGLSVLKAGAGETVLDLGCGAGSTTLALAEAVSPGGHVTGIDVSSDLLAVARSRLGSHPAATLVEDDAGLHGFAEHAFDGLFSRFGMMFFDDPPAAFGNLVRAMRPGARAVMVAWREPARNQWAAVPMTFVAEHMSGQSPGATGPGPFAWAEPETFLSLLRGVGFRDISHASHEFSAPIGEGDDPDPVARAVSFMMKIGPMASRLRAAPEEARAEAAEFLEHRLQRHVKDGAVRLMASAWIIEARL